MIEYVKLTFNKIYYNYYDNWNLYYIVKTKQYITN